MRAHRWINLGFTIIILFAVLAACRSDELNLNVTYDHLTGLAPQDRVLSGRDRAGTVNSVGFLKDGTHVVGLKIDRAFKSVATDASEFFVVDDPSRPGSKAIVIRTQQSGGSPLADGSTIAGATPYEHLGFVLQREIEAGLDYLIEQIDKFKQDASKIPDSEAVRRLKKTIKDLAAEMTRAEKAARERIKREWLPKIERELEKLRKKLGKLGREDELRPLEDEVKRIRRI
jgi:hypothetical protein